MSLADVIANEAGVCRQTVSAVIHGRHHKVSEKKRQLIQRLLKEYGYRPDPNALALFGHTNHTIGLVIPALYTVITLPMLQAINEEIVRRGYKCYIVSPASVEEEREAIREFCARKVDGIISTWLREDFDFSACKVPAVTISERGGEFQVDYYHGMQLVLEHLLHEHGHEKICFVCDKVSTNSEKYAAYGDFMRAHALPPLPPVETLFMKDPAEKAAELVRSGKVTAFAGTGDILMGRFLNRLLRQGIRVPEDCAVTGFDGGILSVSSPQQLSSAVHPARELAKLGVEALLEKIRGRIFEKLPEKFIVPAFFRGESCGCRGMVFEGSCNDILLDHIKNRSENEKYFDFYKKEHTVFSGNMEENGIEEKGIAD